MTAAIGRHPVHDALAEALNLVAGARLVDLGCGPGGTLQAAAERSPGLRLLGLDLGVDNLAVAAGRLLGHAAVLAVADLAVSLPLADGTVDAAVTHNVLELLADPVALMDEVARIVRPGGTAVFSHTNFDALIIEGADPQLTATIVHAYAHIRQPWMPRIDGHAAERLPSWVAASRLHLTGQHLHCLESTTLDGHARRRIDEVTQAVRGHITRGVLDLDPASIDRWRADLEQATAFRFAETAHLVTAVVPPK